MGPFWTFIYHLKAGWVKISWRDVVSRFKIQDCERTADCSFRVRRTFYLSGHAMYHLYRRYSQSGWRIFRRWGDWPKYYDWYFLAYDYWLLHRNEFREQNRIAIILTENLLCSKNMSVCSNQQLSCAKRPIFSKVISTCIHLEIDAIHDGCDF